MAVGSIHGWIAGLGAAWKISFCVLVWQLGWENHSIGLDWFCLLAFRLCITSTSFERYIMQYTQKRFSILCVCARKKRAEDAEEEEEKWLSICCVMANERSQSVSYTRRAYEKPKMFNSLKWITTDWAAQRKNAQRKKKIMEKGISPCRTPAWLRVPEPVATAIIHSINENHFSSRWFGVRVVGRRAGHVFEPELCTKQSTHTGARVNPAISISCNSVSTWRWNDVRSNINCVNGECDIHAWMIQELMVAEMRLEAFYHL